MYINKKYITSFVLRLKPNYHRGVQVAIPSFLYTKSFNIKQLTDES